MSGTEFPSKEAVKRFIEESSTPLGKREIARAFHISGTDRIRLKSLLKELQSEGVIEKGRSRKLAPPDALPAVAVIDIVALDSDGELLARPAAWRSAGDPPVIYVAPDNRGHASLAPGDRALARLSRERDGGYRAKPMRKLDGRRGLNIVGVYHSQKGGGGWVEPTDRRAKERPQIGPMDTGGADDGDLVITEAGSPNQRSNKAFRVSRILGRKDQPKLFSLIAITEHGIPTEFPSEVIDDADAGAVPPLGDREDLRSIPLVTIDGADARDFDDAVFAEPYGDDGWHLIVAIADVAHYVRPGTALDKEAKKRGNSCYFPDRVVPMLPEALSNGLCSLRPNEDRGCLAVHLWIDKNGHPKRHRFVRGLMRSVARLTYEQVQEARNGAPDDVTGPLSEAVIAPLYGAYEALNAAREQRGTLDLNLAETKVELNDAGEIAKISRRPRFDSHKLIEEFMIAANVAAASELMDRNHPVLLRVHEPPDRAKVIALNDFLEPMGYRIDPGQVLKPRSFMGVLNRAKGRLEEPMVNELVLRTQSQARYGTQPPGHFGLALPRYAHFTSPIRRYADLTVHRGLIRSARLGDDGAPPEELVTLDEIGQHISSTERRAAAAERDATDRYVAAWLGKRIGRTFQGRISGVTRFGLFLRLTEGNADGFVPIGSLPDDHYDHDERSHALVGRRWGRVFRLGASVRAVLMEADGLTGSTVLHLSDADQGADLAADLPPPKSRPGRPPRSSRAAKATAAARKARAVKKGGGKTRRK